MFLENEIEDNNIKQVTTLLLNKDANPNTLIPTYGVTPFHLVIGNDSEAFAEEVTKLFLRHGGNPNVKSAEGLTPVHVAAAWGRVRVLELLLANGGDPFCLDDEGRSPFHYAFDGKYYKAIVELGKYCDNNAKEEKATNYKVTFNKLLINNGNIIAEYTAPQISELQPTQENMLNDNIMKEHEGEEFADIEHLHSFNLSDNSINNDNQFDTNVAELQIREEMFKEKFLVNEIINKLSNSLKSNSKEQESNEDYELSERIQYDKSTSSAISSDNSILYNMKDKFALKMKTKKQSVTPKYKRQIFKQNNVKIPLIPMYNTNDIIVSKSPNFLMNNSIENEQRYSSPKILNKEMKFQTFTPCITRNQSFRSEEFNFGKEMARSTPRRRKRFYRQYSSLKKLRKNIDLASSENTSPDSTNSLSPDQNCANKLNHKFKKNLAIRLSDTKYDDDDIPININRNEPCTDACTLKEDIIKLSNNFNNFNIGKTNFIKNNEDYLKEYDLQNKFADEEVELKINSTANSIKGSLNTLLTSFKSESFISVQEEYKYEDPDEGVGFLERRIYTLPSHKTADCTSSDKMWPNSLNISVNTCPTDEILRKRLINLGDNPGPITSTTRQLYLKRLINLEKESHNLSSLGINNFKIPFETTRDELQTKPFLMYGDWINDLGRYRIIEKNIFKEFSLVSPSRKWREGLSKICFNYLLLDPSITKELPLHADKLPKSTVWNRFISAIFYVGKGTRNRPYAHLKEAFHEWISNRHSENAKINKILDIWNKGYGVISLHIFHNSIPVEAYTREAAMIDALGVQKLKNCKNGDYYGQAATWNTEEKRNFGRYLLYQAMQIFLYEGQREIFPDNV
ncbi:uncharacterized protein LOC143422702 isoform X2 [Xylocopa sonorina]|uniref:uncharacterized protein LOC143422702 isoform X2 n=1 Tax=Xylocopa sonorina TaxID=1818115 RepID=UPI00403ADFB4